MTAMLSLTVTEDGLHLPRQLFPRLGEVEVIELNNYILIKPKPRPITANDLRTLAMAALHEAGLLITLAWQPLSPVSAAERAELASRLSGTRPLSEIIVEERTDRHNRR